MYVGPSDTRHSRGLEYRAVSLDRDDFYWWFSGGDGRGEALLSDAVVWREMLAFEQERIACACFEKEELAFV